VKGLLADPQISVLYAACHLMRDGFKIRPYCSVDSVFTSQWHWFRLIRSY